MPAVAGTAGSFDDRIFEPGYVYWLFRPVSYLYDCILAFLNQNREQVTTGMTN
ncbi:hypothetical protein Hmuk_0938 [Halomicrobium mukohataei DSM 12286]|uniref:Uncharacterized protein n=1 Tax=Halomicrobium mukohataei (strain ATCC 700874 / DSM 12286 / JCM 9738 / NCIMB 13541) TaxID=485914 RepID=C7P0T5_HALMD|nr:hypothetical protein Hmuk_0938 [Halomicrobium mukohataei DSM 12286]